MKRLACAFALSALSFASLAQELATCREPSGFAYFPNRGLIEAKSAGWEKDKISNGVFTLRRTGDADYDVLYLDATKKIHSTNGEGGVVKLLRKGDKEMSFILFYPGSTIEIYTFLRDKTGRDKLSILTSKGGDGLIQYKQSIMIAECSPITFLTP